MGTSSYLFLNQVDCDVIYQRYLSFIYLGKQIIPPNKLLQHLLLPFPNTSKGHMLWWSTVLDFRWFNKHKWVPLKFNPINVNTRDISHWGWNYCCIYGGSGENVHISNHIHEESWQINLLEDITPLPFCILHISNSFFSLLIGCSHNLNSSLMVCQKLRS